MSDKTKILIKTSGWAGFFLLVVLLSQGPQIYFYLNHGGPERHAVCGSSSPYARDTDIHEIASHMDFWTNQQVSLSGELSYDPIEKTFYLSFFPCAPFA